MTRDDRVHPQMKLNHDEVGVFTGRLKNYCEMSTGKEVKSRHALIFPFTLSTLHILTQSITVVIPITMCNYKQLNKIIAH